MFEKPKNTKGGRPPKEVKRLRTLSVKCSFFDGMQIENKAKQVGLSVSEYLREMGLKGAVKLRVKTLHREVLQLTGTLNHIAANLNQIAKKRNSFDELSVLERARLNQLHIPGDTLPPFRRNAYHGFRRKAYQHSGGNITKFSA